MDNRIILFILALFICSCSAERRASNKIERARRLIDKARVLDPLSVSADTVYSKVMVTVPRVEVDTLFIDRGVPVIIEKDRIKISYIRDTVTNEVIIEGECKPDTIIKEVATVIQPTAITKQSFWKTLPGKIVIIISILAVALFVLGVISRVT